MTYSYLNRYEFECKMDFRLLSDPLPKPWCNIAVNNLTANSLEISDIEVKTLEAETVEAGTFIITGDGSFGSNGNPVDVTLATPTPAYIAYAPNATPTIAANSLQVGTTFKGELSGAAAASGVDFLNVDVNFGASLACRMRFTPPAISLPNSAIIRYQYSIYVIQTNPTCLLDIFFTVTFGGNSGGGTGSVHQSRVFSQLIDQSVNMPISITGFWQNAAPNNFLQLNTGWLRRVI